MVTIVFAHPWYGSFNKAILDTVISVLVKEKKEYKVIDLNKENFNPVMTEEELALYSKGQHKDPLVTKYQSMLRKTDEIIFIFPLWWYDTPAILKGFFDKVMLKNFAYIETSTGLKGQLTNIKSAKVITTGQSPRWYLKLIAGNLIQKTFINTTLKSIGITNAKWLYCGDVSKGAQEKREKFLQKLANSVLK
ncbi:NAD(P)H-dependent oxidoreductase [Faecalispora sporosphaeroides]|jgi:putative NADPH-quinone reductase|uniref:Flavodoxin family protein n=1 Tax=Faecalispora sporosphaeroides TaxID=1549 RepID=A0A928Q332_9FIRM|nr:NAD(P)H-dependent oxidoreductase [Faecalispora sporosphaeroides]MBE6832471.1 flavodoxin family protein [Faecalispora sporosphaeroides]